MYLIFFNISILMDGAVDIQFTSIHSLQLWWFNARISIFRLLHAAGKWRATKNINLMQQSIKGFVDFQVDYVDDGAQLIKDKNLREYNLLS